MATEVLRPQDCLRPDSVYDGFSSLQPYPNRRRNRPVRPNSNQTTTPSPKPKHSRPNPKPSRKSSSALSTSPPLQEGFRLLKRGEAFRPDRPGSDTGPSPVERAQLLEKKRQPGLARSDPETPPTKGPSFFRKSEAEKTPAQKKAPTDRVRSEFVAPVPVKKPAGVGSEKKSRYAGPFYLSNVPEAKSVPLPSFLRKSSSVEPTSSEDEASRTLRGLLKLDFQ